MSKFVNQFLSVLDGKVSDKDLTVISQELESFIYNFDISEKVTHLCTNDIFPPFYKMFFVAKKISGCADGSLQTYKIHLDYFFNWIHKPYDQISTEDILAFLYHLQKDGKDGQKPMSANVTDNVRRILNSFFEWAVSNRYTAYNPVSAIPKIKGEKKRRKPLTELELERVRYAMYHEVHRYKKYDDMLVKRNMALFEVMYSTGARISEIVALNKDDINFDTHEVHLYGKGKKHRISYLNAKAIVYLTEYLQSRKDDNVALFVNYKSPHDRITISAARAQIKKWGNQAHIKGNIYPHRIRHTTATHALSHGMPLEQLQMLLGHEKPETTLIYADVLQSNVKSSHLKYVI